MDDEIQTWWEIPSIVHFCKVFTHITKDISKIDTNEFENAIKENSYLLTDMAIRFTKVCGFYDPNTNEWWNVMKKKFQSECIVYNFKYSLDSATYFDDLTRKQKVEALYIFCNFILDVKHIQNKLSNSPNIWHMLNVKPLGYDLNKSVYWYFGNNKLYREDFEKSFDLSTNLPVDNNVHRRLQYEPYPSGVFGPGKWNKICDNIDNWHSLADITEYSKNINIIYLHKAISNIILNLPKVKENKSCYTYIKPLRSICTRRLRSMDVKHAKPKKNISNSSVIQHKQYSQNIMENLTKQRNDSTASQRNEISNLKVFDQNQNVSYSTNMFDNDNTQIGKLNNKTALKLPKNGNEKMLSKCVKNNIEFERVLCIKIKRCDQEDTH
ncbi:PREDICTED: uncharacterized protein LOC107167169 isoform X1 [Diuraphis noxia]|uniref:uncharacterized protein LOC107167169 isoform X1 n=1 Tax=Diuraphis noxia TaxID=143948 RepID=UPI0007637629|nr:PREDICTED: uncharacterized protein LOC107167169 isoform X1 [Diuraphis noxia]